MVWRTSQWNLCKISLYRKWILSSERAKWVFSNFNKRTRYLGNLANCRMFHYSLRVIDEPKMSDIKFWTCADRGSIFTESRSKDVSIWLWILKPHKQLSISKWVTNIDIDKQHITAKSETYISEWVLPLVHRRKHKATPGIGDQAPFSLVSWVIRALGVRWEKSRATPEFCLFNTSDL